MKRSPDGLGPVVTLDRRKARPMHRQLYDGYREAILDGRLRPGQRLPSTRALAEDLGISRIPAVTAFAQLLAEGYLESRVGAGTFVSAALPDPPPPRAAREPAAAARPGSRRVPPTRLGAAAEPWLDLYGPFRLHQPALDEFPADLWARLVARHARRLSPRQMAYGDSMGLPALREALATHLRTFRSVVCSADQIMIVSGSQQALALSARALLAPGDAAWLEDPGYRGAREALLVAGARIVPVPVDEDGLDVAAGVARAADARLAYVTPSHQYPLGVVMSASRRLAILDWARRRGSWLIEDDYDSEYRYAGPSLTSLQGLDRDARVLYVGTFSKILFPALRVGYLVVPRDLVPRFRRFRDAMDIFPAPLLQAVLADLIDEGHFARHLRRMRALYAERRRALVGALDRELGDSVHVIGDHAGMHLVTVLPQGADDQSIASRAARRGISAAPLSSCYSGPAARQGLILGFGSTRPRQMSEAVRKLKAAIGG
jgi:GntR family transcriptional regulator/MocR family aminotransferase